MINGFYMDSLRASTRISNAKAFVWPAIVWPRMTGKTIKLVSYQYELAVSTSLNKFLSFFCYYYYYFFIIVFVISLHKVETAVGPDWRAFWPPVGFLKHWTQRFSKVVTDSQLRLIYLWEQQEEMAQVKKELAMT